MNAKKKRSIVVYVFSVLTLTPVASSFALSSEESAMLFEECMTEYWLSDLKTCKAVFKDARATIASEDQLVKNE